MEAHGEDLRSVADDPTLVEILKRDYTQVRLSSSHRAMLEFARKLTQTPDQMSQDDLQRLTKEGFDDLAILEIVHIVGYFNYINRVADALGVEPEQDWSQEG